MNKPVNPKWVMCPLPDCLSVVYAGPGVYPVYRECQCKATRVMPKIDKGYIEWDTKRYEAAGFEEPEVEEAAPGEVLDPYMMVRPEAPRTIDDAVADAMRKLG